MQNIRIQAKEGRVGNGINAQKIVSLYMCLDKLEGI